MSLRDTGPRGGLPAPPALTSGLFGATAVFTALAIGSGELMFWPGLVLTSGAGVLWTAIVAVALQWLINVEMARYTLATGESIVVGAAHRSRIMGVVLILGAIIPWIWPGWVRSAGQLAAALTGLPERHVSAAGLLACFFLLAAPARVYPLVERLQSVLLAIILSGVAALFGLVLLSSGGLGGFVAQFLSMQGGAAAVSDILARSDAAYFGLLGGVVFAGAGGILNVGYAMLLREKGVGMAAATAPMPGLLKSLQERAPPRRQQMADTAANRALFPSWLRLVRLEHGILFLGGNIASILFVSATFFMLFAGSGSAASGVDLLKDVATRLAAAYGQGWAVLFGVVGFLVFWTSALGILDITSRVAASIAHTLAGPRGPSLGRWYHGFVAFEALSALILIYADPRQPFLLLATSAVLNTVVMAAYTFVTIWLTRSDLPQFARPPRLVTGIAVMAGLLYAAVFGLTLTKLG